jgi:hypothetical protein
VADLYPAVLDHPLAQRLDAIGRPWTSASFSAPSVGPKSS